jgi:hypothetical protein
MAAETIKFRLGKNPLVKEKIIILEETDGRKAVIFPQYRIKEDIQHAEVAKEGEVLDLTGKWGVDKKSGAPQFFVDSAYNAAYTEPYVFENKPKGKVYKADEVDPVNDFIIGGLSTAGKPIVASEPREGKKQYYTDGDWEWFQGSTNKMPTSF